tara:strand:+ start:227 stop:862 length:636 start_codon:yes stop_codon:yes gene_type:complete
MLVFILSGFLYFNVITEIYKDTENNKALFERRNCLNSNVHAYTVLILSVLYLVNYSFIVKFYSGLLGCSAMFAAYDISVLHKNNVKNRNALTLHHGIIIVGLIILNLYYSDDEYKTKLVAINYLAEFSTPFLNKSLIMYNNNLTHLPQFKNLNILVVVNYFIFRILGGGVLVYLTSFESTFILVMQSSLTGLNVFWFFKLIKMALKQRKKK